MAAIFSNPPPHSSIGGRAPFYPLHFVLRRRLPPRSSRRTTLPLPRPASHPPNLPSLRADPPSPPIVVGSEARHNRAPPPTRTVAPPLPSSAAHAGQYHPNHASTVPRSRTLLRHASRPPPTRPESPSSAPPITPTPSPVHVGKNPPPPLRDLPSSFAETYLRRLTFPMLAGTGHHHHAPVPPCMPAPHPTMHAGSLAFTASMSPSPTFLHPDGDPSPRLALVGARPVRHNTRAPLRHWRGSFTNRQYRRPSRPELATAMPAEPLHTPLRCHLFFGYVPRHPRSAELLLPHRDPLCTPTDETPIISRPRFGGRQDHLAPSPWISGAAPPHPTTVRRPDQFRFPLRIHLPSTPASSRRPLFTPPPPASIYLPTSES